MPALIYIIIIIAIAVTAYFFVSKNKIARKMKDYQKRASYALLGANVELAKDIYSAALKEYFAYVTFNSLLRGFDIRGNRKIFHEFFEFKGLCLKKLNEYLILKNLNTVSTEQSDKYEIQFTEKLNYSDKNSFKHQKMDLEVYNKIIDDYSHLIGKEFQIKP